MSKLVSVVLVVVMIMLVMTPTGMFKASAEAGQTIFINEVMTSNTSTVRDGDVDDPTYGSLGGAYVDWIEIYNSGSLPVDLTNYTLADSSATWTFPQGVVPANGYLVIWASDKDKVASNGQLHTNFKLSSSGEPVTLNKPDGVTVDSVTVPSLTDDESYGRRTDGSSEMVVFSKATPGTANIYVDPGMQTLFINEVMSSNASTIRDGDVEDLEFGSQGGAYSDWIEIYNSSSSPVILTNYTLSDSSATWTFPQGTVPAYGYLMVWASDKDKVARDGQLHTNFKLGASGEPVVLKKPDGTVVDSVEVVGLMDDQSYGRKVDAGSEFAVFTKSTPGDTNTNGISPVQEPSFSHQGGFYTSAFDLQLTSNEAGVKIYYTKDGSDPVPGASGTYEYTGSINVKSRAGDPNVLSMIQNISNDNWNPWKAPNGEIFKCTNIKAVAIRTDGTKSKMITHSYFVDSNMNSRYTLPVVSLVTDQSNLFDNSTGLYVNGNYEESGSEWERPIHIEYFEKDGTPGFSQSAAVRIHGGWTRKYPQKSFRLYADHDEDELDKFKYEIFPGLKRNATGKNLKSFERLILRNAGNDWTSAMFRDEMMQSLVSHLGSVDTQAYRPSIVFLNGEYWGIYHFRERYDQKYLADHYDLDDDKVAILDMYQTIEVQEGTPEDATAYTNEITRYLESHSITDQSTYDYIKTKMDVENFIDYNVAQIFFGNTDWPGNNVSIWKYKTDDGQYHPEAPYGQDGRWRWFIKDTDFGFGLYGKSATDDTLQFATSEWGQSYANAQWATFLLRTLLKNTDFRNEFINRFADQLNTSFVPERVNEVIDKVVSILEPEMKEHTDRWQYIKMASTDPRNPAWSETVKQIKNYGTNRQSNVRQHILNKFRNNGVSGTANVSLNSDTARGYIRINSIDIKSSTPAVANPNSWTGVYFKGVPVTIKAVPQEGYEFDRWEGLSGVSQTSDTVTFTLTGDTSVTAVFKQSAVIPTPTPSSTPTPTPSDNIVYGDANGDGAANSIDFAILRMYLLGMVGIEVIDTKAADVDASGAVNAIDFAYMRMYLLGMIDKFPAEGA